MNPAQDAKTARKATGKSEGRTRPRRARRAPPGDLTALRRELWHGLRRVGEVFDDPDADAADLCKALNALAAASNAFRGVTEAGELVARLEALEAAQGGRP